MSKPLQQSLNAQQTTALLALEVFHLIETATGHQTTHPSRVFTMGYDWEAPCFMLALHLNHFGLPLAVRQALTTLRAALQQEQPLLLDTGSNPLTEADLAEPVLKVLLGRTPPGVLSLDSAAAPSLRHSNGLMPTCSHAQCLSWGAPSWSAT